MLNLLLEAGDRSKISVYSENPDIDAVGACVGSKGARVEAVVEELGGEKIDIVQWNEDPKVFVRNALSPSQVLEVIRRRQSINSCCSSRLSIIFSNW